MTSIDDDVHAYITDRQRARRKGVPLALIAATHGPAGVAAAHRLIQAGRAYWATNAARPGGDRYNLIRTHTMHQTHTEATP